MSSNSRLPSTLLEKIFFYIERNGLFLREYIWKIFYSYLAKKYPNDDCVFMNYGYFDAEMNNSLVLKTDDERNRYFIQLYEQVIKDQTLQNKNILEVGSGRGGGCAYIASEKTPAKIVGMDLSKSAIEFCMKRYRFNNLEFQQGSAGNIPFSDHSFDVVINVESSHHYPSFDQFLKEAYRVLRP